MKDELYKKDELIKVLKEDLGKVKHELDRTCKWNKASGALSWLREHHSNNKRGLGYGTLEASTSLFLKIKSAHNVARLAITKMNAMQKKRPVQVKGRSQIWYMDSGFSKHMTGNKDQFLSLQDLKGGNVSFGNGKKGEIIGVRKSNENHEQRWKEYIMVLVDDYSRFTWVLFLTSKDEAFDIFIAFVRKTQKQLGNQLASIRSDHGTEFENSKFAEFYDENEERVHVVFDETNILSERQEHEDEAIGLVKELTESPAQVKVASKEGTSDGPGFEKKECPEHVYKLDKALYGLKQAPRACTLFVREKGKNLLVVQIYVDDIIFGATTDRMSKDFAKLMGSEFEISMMGELNFFLGLQIKQSLNGTMIHQQKYTKELIKKFKMEESKEIDTPFATTTKLDIDEPGSSVDQKLYRGMIGSLLYLTTSRPDIIFSVGLCARFQANPKESHLTVVKRILRYLKGTTDLCLWYSKGSNFDLVGYADADYAGFLVDRKNTSGMAHFLGSCLVSWATKKLSMLKLSMLLLLPVVLNCCGSNNIW
ncbi:uncharacterized protein [Nicotiana sylvestris]|uniref:uncharacterized protein n=1 Tax=Nicotiana sylvestris TaxID=4096 RepID=UPI00388C38A8